MIQFSHKLKQIYIFTCLLSVSVSAFATDYHVNSATGSDANTGKSKETAWKTLKKVNSKNFKAGDKILLATGQEFFGSIVLESESGKKSNPIEISSYVYNNATEKPIINAKGFLNGIN